MPNRHARLGDSVEFVADDRRPLSTLLEFRLARAIRDERRRMARDLHAGVLQRLAATRMHLSTAIEADACDTKRLADLAEGVDLAARELREMVSSSAPPLLNERGIGQALNAVAVAAPLAVTIDDRLTRRHPARVELAVYFACREQLQNVIKHAGPAAQARVHITDQHAGVEFSVTDDGIGFDPAGTHSGVGLFNISERIATAGGNVSIASTAGRGTMVSGHVPDLLNGQSVEATSDLGRFGPRTPAGVSRRHIVLETDAERRRIMRDLHDGAQQRLVALRVKVSLAIERAGVVSSERATLERTATELDLAIGELRDLARGLLVSSGATAVAPALRNVTRHWPMAVHVRERNVNAFDPKAEAAVYGCVLEALQHARAQRAPAAKSSAVVSLVGVSDAIHFVVRGRGTAFDPGRATAHDSAEHIADRAHAAGGSLSFEALPGRGLLMRGSIPLSGGM